ncbi:hypothetical protein N665_1684s0003 [Sinapis alba]|nr:hypothetical protein N665_1684s0003 [Sinapis alba]
MFEMDLRKKNVCELEKADEYITEELSQHGQIAEKNVYNWFQNRRARSKRKQHGGGGSNNNNNGESKVETDQTETVNEKRKISESSCSPNICF